MRLLTTTSALIHILQVYERAFAPSTFTIILTIKVISVYVCKCPHVYTNKHSYFQPIIYAQPIKSTVFEGYASRRWSRGL